MMRVVLRQPPLRRVDRPLVAFVRDSRDAFAAAVLARSLSGASDPVRLPASVPGLRLGFPAGTARCLALGLLCGGRGRESCEGPVATLQWPEESTLVLDPCVRASIVPLRFADSMTPVEDDCECIYMRGSNLVHRRTHFANVLAVLDAEADPVPFIGATALAIALGAQPAAVSQALQSVSLKPVRIPGKEGVIA